MWLPASEVQAVWRDRLRGSSLCIASKPSFTQNSPSASSITSSVQGLFSPQARNYYDSSSTDYDEDEGMGSGIDSFDKKRPWIVQSPNKFGHYYTQIGGPITCEFTEEQVHNLLASRMQCKMNQEFTRADEIQDELKEAGVYVNDIRQVWRADGKNFFPRKAALPNMRECQSIEMATQVIHGDLERALPRDLAAFWSVISRLLDPNDDQDGKQEEEKQKQLEEQLISILVKTMGQMEKFEPRDLAQVALAFAKISNRRRRVRGGPTIGSHSELLHSLIEDKREMLFRKIAYSSMSTLTKFQSRYLSNMAYAFALAGHDPEIDGSTLIHHIAKESIPLLKRFNPQDLYNIMWAYTKSGASHPHFLTRVVDHVVSLRHLDHFKPRELASISIVFARTRNVSLRPLFDKVADHIIALDHLGKFNPRDLSNIVKAYATAGEPNPPLFAKVADHIVALDHLGAFNRQDISDLIRAYEEAGIFHRQLFARVEEVRSLP